MLDLELQIQMLNLRVDVVRVFLEMKYKVIYNREGCIGAAACVAAFEDMWGLVQASNPLEIHLFCPEDPANCGDNNSKRQIHLVSAAIRPAELRWLRQSGYIDSTSKVNFSGFTDRYGTIIKNGSCESASLDCVPLELANYDSSVRYQYRGDTREYDLSIGVLPQSPIRYPN